QERHAQQRGGRADDAGGGKARARGHDRAGGVRRVAVSLTAQAFFGIRVSPPASATPRFSMSPRVPRSRLPASSYPSRNACCSVTTSLVPLPASTNSMVARDTEIFLS